MRKGLTSRYMWLLLLVAFAAIAGGGCNGSSSGGSSGEPAQLVGGSKLEGDLGKLLESRLGEDFGHETYVLGLKGVTLTDEQRRELREIYDSGAAVVLHGHEDGHIGEMRELFGIDSSVSASSASVSTREDEDSGEAKPEMVAFRKVGSDIFEGNIIFIDGKNGGAQAEVSGGLTVQTQELDHPNDGTPEPKSVLSKEQIHELDDKRDESVHYHAMIDSLVTWNRRVNEHAERVSSRRGAATAQMKAAAAGDDLSKLAKAHIITNDWHFSDIDGGYKSPTVYQTITIYSCYSYDNNKDWHLIETSSSMNPQDIYKHEKMSSGIVTVDVVHNYTRKFKSWAINKTKDEGAFWLEAHLPQNMNSGYTKTDSFSSNVGGSVGFQGSNPTGSLTGGITVGNSTAYTVHDYEAKDLTDKKNPCVVYEFTPPANGDRHFSYMDLKDASDVSRYNFTSNESWIWCVDHGNAEADRYKFDQHVQYWIGASRGNLCAGWISMDDRKDIEATWADVYKEITIPTPPTLGTSATQLLVNAKGRTTSDEPVKFTVLSDGDWSASCDAAWIKLDTTAGGKTGSTPKEILVQIQPNTGDIRKATITVKGTRGQVGTITVSQEGAK